MKVEVEGGQLKTLYNQTGLVRDAVVLACGVLIVTEISGSATRYTHMSTG